MSDLLPLRAGEVRGSRSSSTVEVLRNLGLNAERDGFSIVCDVRDLEMRSVRSDGIRRLGPRVTAARRHSISRSGFDINGCFPFNVSVSVAPASSSIG